MLYFLALLLSLVTTPVHATTTSRCPAPWIFFDLGNTLIDARDPDLNHLKYLPGMPEKLERLERAGHRLGMIVNVPEEWGKTQEEKLQSLKDFVKDRWEDRVRFDWDMFTEGAGVFLPPSDIFRKPNPYLFRQAMAAARAKGCTAIYIGEDDREKAVARAVGMSTSLPSAITK